MGEEVNPGGFVPTMYPEVLKAEAGEARERVERVVGRIKEELSKGGQSGERGKEKKTLQKKRVGLLRSKLICIPRLLARAQRLMFHAFSV